VKQWHKIIVGITLLALIGTAGFQVLRQREPQYNGVGLGKYIEQKFAMYQWSEAVRAVKATGDTGVRYLIRQMRRDPLTELEIKASRYCPVSVQKFLPKQVDYQNRRIRASTVLDRLGTNAVVALPDCLEILESDTGFGPRQSCLNIVVKFAPGTKLEQRALEAMCKLAESGEREERRTALFYLMKFPNHTQEVVPVLVRSLKHPGMYGPCSAALITIGPAAIPALQEEAAKELFHVRPATLVLEQMQKNGVTGSNQ